MPMNIEMKDALVEKLDELNELVAKAQEQLNASSSRVAVLEHEIAVAKTELESDRRSLNDVIALETIDANAQVLGAGGFAGYANALEAVNREVGDVEAQLTQLTSLQNLFSKFVAEAEKNQSCSLCKRGFPSAESTDSFIQYMQQNMAKVPAQIAVIEERVEKTRERRKLLLDLSEAASQFKTLSEKVPDSERLFAELEVSFATARETEKLCEKEIAEKRQSASVVGSIMEDAGNISRLAKEVQALQDAVEALQLNVVNVTGETRSALDISNDL